MGWNGIHIFSFINYISHPCAIINVFHIPALFHGTYLNEQQQPIGWTGRYGSVIRLLSRAQQVITSHTICGM